jgi:hypothetical protein
MHEDKARLWITETPPQYMTKNKKAKLRKMQEV